MFNLLLGSFLTIVVGGYITYRYERNNVVYEAFILSEQNRVDNIHQIIKRLNNLILLRAENSKNVLDLYDGDTEDKNSEKNIVRLNYISAKDSWNNEIKNIFVELGNLNIYGYATKIERVIHEEFVEIHKDIIAVKEKQDKSSLNDALLRLHNIAKNRINIIDELRKESNLIINDIKFGKTEPLTFNNLDKAPMHQLIIALFYQSPGRLRIPRS